MFSLEVIAKRGGEVSQILASDVSLKTASVVRIGLSSDRVKGMRRVGNDLVVTAVSGEVITIHDFFTAFDGNRNDLVLNDDQEGLWLAEISENQGDLAVEYLDIDSIEPLLLHQDFDLGVVPFLVGGALLAGAAFAGRGDKLQAFLLPSALPVPGDTTAPAAPTINPTNGKLITGIAEAGSVITIKDDSGNVIGRTTAASDGTYSIAPANPPRDGTPLHAVATDAAGNPSPEATAAVDGAPPVIGIAILNDANKDGFINASEKGADVTVQVTLVSGAAAGDVITLAAGTASSSITLTAADVANGFVNASFANPVEGGAISVSATSRDMAGNVSPPVTTGNVRLDTSAPGAPAIGAASDDMGPVQGPLASGGITDDTTPTLTGSGATPGDVIKVYDNGSAIGSTTVRADGGWSFTPPKPLPEGTHRLTTTAVDPAGNESRPSAAFTVEVDTTPPAALEASGIQLLDDIGAVRGPIAAGAQTDDSKPEYVGKADPAQVSSVRVYDNGTLIGSTAVNADGTWRFTPALPLSTGAHSFTAQAVDMAGNASPLTPASTFTLLGDAPAAPAIVGVSDNKGSINGNIAKDASTDDNTPTLSGTGTVGTVVTVYADGVAVGSASVAANGTWSVTTDPLTGDGVKNLSAIAVDGAGQASPATGDYPIVLDTTAPATPATLVATDDQGAVTGPIPAGGSTDDASPTFSGTGARAGDIAKLYDGATPIGSTAVKADGSWSLTPDKPLGEGAHSITHTLTDAAGNTSAASAPLAFRVDTSNVVVSVGHAVDDQGSKQGNLAPGALTDDTTPTLVGTATATAVVTVTENATVIGSTTADGNGNWRLTLPAQAEGTHKYTATAVNAAGTKGEASLSLTIDTTAPTAPSIAKATDDVGSVQGPLTSGSSTDDTTPTLTGSGATPGDVISVYDNASPIGSATVLADGSWSFTPTTPLAEGAHRLSTSAIDAAGNESPRSGDFTVDVDTTPPSRPDASFIQVLDDVGAVQGPIASGTQTDDSRPTYTGKADPAQVSSINVYDNGSLIGSTAVNADGTWRFEPALPLSTGAHSLTAQAVDAAGNASALTPASTFTLLGTAPAAPAITGVSDNRGGVTGNIAKDTSTDDNTPTLSGTGTVGTVVTVYADGVAVGSASVAANGTWSVTTDPLGADGVKNLSAIAVDGAGQASPATGIYPIALDTAPPATPGVVLATDKVGAVQGTVASGGTTDDVSPSFSGSGVKAGDTVRVYDGATLIGSATVATDGGWSVTPAAPLGAGLHSITQTVTDAAGNTSAASAPLAFTVDTSDVIVSVKQSQERTSGRGARQIAGLTNDNTPTLAGKATAGAVVTVTEGAAVLGSTAADANGNWSLTLPEQAEGAHEYKATAVNAAGTNGQAILGLTIDTTPPKIPAIGQATDDVGTLQGPLATGGASDDTTPTLSGSGATAGDVITVYDNGSAVGSTTVKADGSWSFTPTTPLAEGAHRLTTTATDPVGNESKPSSDFVITVDTVAPATPVAATGYADNVGAIQNPASTASITDDTTPGINIGTLLNGLTPSLYVDGIKVASTYDPVAGTLTPNVPLGDGAHQIGYTLTDAAGNESKPAPALAVTVNTIAPAAPVAVTGYADNVGAVQSPNSTAPTTDDTTPGLNIAPVPSGSTPSLYVDGTKVAATYDPALGTLTPDAPLAEGAHRLSYTLTNTAGNESAQAPALAVVVDNTAPVAPVMPTSYADDIGTVRNPASTAPSTDDTMLGLNIGTVPADTTPSLYIDGFKFAATYDPAAGTLTPNAPLAEGSHRLSYTLTDAAGNESAPSGALVVNMDITPPPALDASVLQVLDDVGSTQGPIASGAQTDDSKPTYAGKADTAQVASVNVYDNGKLIGSTAVNADGTWRFTPALPLATGPHSFTAQAVDAAGNVSAATPASTFTLLGDAPAAPAITGVSDDKGSVSGSIAQSASTDDNTPTLSGTGTVGTVVTVYADGVAVGSTSVAANGTWSVTTSPLSGDGVKNLKAIAVDGAGQASPATGDYPIVLDTTAPATPATVVATDDQGAVTGAIPAGGSTDDASPTFSGSGAKAGDTVKLYDGAALIGSTAVKADGTWSLTPEKPLAKGAHSITHTLTDAAGNTSAASAPLSFTVDTSGVVVSITHAVDDQGSKQGNLAPGAVTDDTTPTLVGTATAGSIITIREDSSALGSTTADTNGNWSLALPVQAEGAHKYTATAVNAAGTKGEATLALTIDTTAPNVPTIAKATDDVGSVQGPLATGGASDDTTPTLSGAGATPGDVIKVYDNGSPIGSTTVQAGGSWSFTPTTPLAEGTHQLTTTSIDPVGNESKPSGSFVVNVDTTPPTAKATLSAIGTDTGTSSSDFVTSDRTLVATVTVDKAMEPGATVQISLDNGRTWNKASLVGGDTYQFDNTATALADGSHTFLARVVDAAGNAGPPTSQVVVIDTSAPTADNAVAITAYIDDVAPNTGEYNTGTSTNDTTPTLKGTVSGLKTGDVVQIYEGTTLLGTATVSGSAWTFATPALADGSTHSYTAAIADAAGNRGTTSGAFSLTVDTTVPTQAVTIVSYTDDIGTNRGDFASGTSTDDTAPVLNGKLSDAIGATDVVRIYEGTTLLGTATVTGTSWTFAVPALTSGSTHSYTAAIADAAGNVGAASPAFTLTVDTTPPAQSVTITAYTDDVGTNRGDFASGTTTDDMTPLLRGTLSEAIGATDVVRIYEGTALLGTATVTGTSWTFATPALANGSTHTYKAVVADAAGNQGAASSAFTLTVSTSAPAQTTTITAYTDNVGPIQGDFASGTSTDDTTPVLRGELGTAIGATDSVRIYEGTTLLGTATVTGTRWSFATSTLAEGSTHSYMAVVADAAGNEGAPSSRFTLTVDTTAPTQAVAITSYLDNQDPQQGTFASGSKTNDTTPQLNGTLAGTLGAGEVVALYRDGVRLGAATMTGAATWTFQDTGLVDGTSYSYTARVEDAAGNRGGASAVFTLVVDQSAPSAAPSIDSITDDVTPVTGPITSGSTTNDTRPELKGSGAEPNGTVRIYDSGRLIGTATADVTGTWSFTPAAGSELSNGAHSLTVSNVDTAGNEGPKSVPVTFTVDTVAPTTPPSIDSVTDDVAPVVGPITAGSTTNDARPELKGTGAEPNGTVRVYDNGALIGSATADGTGKWSFTPEMGKELANGAHSLAVSSVDAAGNEGPKSTPLAFTVDTVAPTAAPSIDALIDDTEPVTGPVTPGGTTNDTRPELKGAGAEPNGIVRVYDNGALIGSATADAAGKWSFTPDTGKELANGAHSLAASNVDAAGNEGPKSAPTAFTVATVAPTGAPSIDSVTDDVAPVTGPIVSGSTTNDTRPELKGSGAQPNGTVRIYDNGALIGSTTADASGKWSFTPEAGKELANGAHSLTVSNVDAAGNEGPKSAPLAFTVDTVVPSTTPSIDSVTDDVAPVTGPITSGGTTNDARPELKGSGAEPNGTVRVYDNGALIGTAAADASGKWSFTPEAGKELANGAHSLAVSNVDAAGNEGPKSAPLAFTVDTVAPSTAPSIDSVTDDVAPVTGPIIAGGTTNDACPELKGSGAEPNGTVRIYDNGALIGTATADASGKWSFTPEAGKELANGAHSLTTSNVDAAGNEGPKSAPLAFAVDTVAPSSAPSIDSLMDSVAPVTGPIASGGTTNETRPVLTGAGAEPNGTVRIYDNGTQIGSASADGAGNWSFTPEAGKELANGAHSLTTSNVDAAGNEGPKSAPLAFTVDTVPPPVATLSLGNYSDSFAAAGTLAPNQSSDRYSNDNTFDLVLPGADTLAASYEVSTDGGTVWRATTAAQSNLSDGKYLFRATLTDAAGNSTAAANVVAVTVDRTAPGLDLQRVGGSLVAGKTEAGALVAIDVGNNGSVEASVTADADGNWTWTPSTSIAADTVVSAVAYDLAGNASSKGSQAADTTPPEVTIQKSDGTRFSGTTSDADTPTASPTATKPITVTLSVDKNADGVIDYVLPFTATVTADGAWSIDASSAPVNVGAIVTAVARDYNGNASAPAVVTVGGGTSRISGTTRSDNFGYDVQAIGDFNGDGYNDFAVVAPHGSSAERSANKWSVNILYGSKQGLPDLSSVSNLPGTDGLKIFTSGDISDSNILTAVQGYGDVNGDGYSDVILYDDNLNSAWVIFGRSSEGAGSAPVNVDVRTIISSGGDSNGVAIVQREGGSTWFGAAGALVDVNGDGYADIIMQDWQRGTGSSGTAILYGHAGAAGSAAWSNYYVGFTGSSPASYVSDNRNSSAESTRPHTIIYNDNTNGYPTNVMNIGDINGDGYADFAYGMYNARNPAGNIDNAGAIQVIYGTSKGFPQDYSLQTDYTNISNGFRVYGEQANQYLGTYIDPEPYGYLSNTGMPISSGDVNGDGIADMIIGSPQFGPDAGEQRGPGRVYVVYGKAGGAKLNVDLANLSSADGFVITASDGTADAMFGNGTSVGDFNGDGIDDIAIGAPLADVGGKVNNGAVYILYGRQGGYSGIQSVTAKYLGGQSANTADSNYRQNGDANSGSMLGVNVALSDLNGDGQADLALGSAYRGTPGAPATGHLEVVYADAFNFTNLLTVGDDVIAATAGRDRLAGGAGNDVITGVRSGDSAYGGAGNDRIHIEEINGVVRVDGGLGIDTLVVDGSNITLDLSQLGLKVKGFENFDLGRSAANVGNILKLRISDVLNQQSSTGNGNGLGQGHLRVTGDSSDTVELLRDTDSWQNTGTRNVGGVNYDVYHNNTLPPDNTLGDIWIQQGVTVIVNSGGNQAVPAQTVAITSFTDNQDPVQGTFLSGSTTNDATPLLNGTLAGTLGAHEVVGVYRDGTRLGAATLTGATAWTFQDSGLADGATYTYTARVENAVSNRGGAWSAFTMTVDLTPPTTSPSITSYTDDAGASQGNFGSGTTTDDTDPVLNGTLTAALASGEAVRIYEGANLLGTATVSGTTWTYTLGNLADGSTHVYRAVVADAAGGEGPPSSNFTLTADYAVTVNSQVTVDTTPLVTGAMPFKLGKGEYIEVTIDGKTYSSANGSVVVDSQHSTWYVQVPSALKVATYDVQAVVRSASGVSIVSDETSGELVVSKEPDVVVGSASSDAQQKGTAYTVGENGMWRIHSNQSMLDANGTNRATLGSFKLTALNSNTEKSVFSNEYNPTYRGNNFVQNATFMDVNRDGHMDLFTVDSTWEDGQQAFLFNGSSYNALQVGGRDYDYKEKKLGPVGGDSNVLVSFGGLVAFDKTGTGFVGVAYGDQPSEDRGIVGMGGSHIVLNPDGNIRSMTKDPSYTDSDSAGGATDSARSTNRGNTPPDRELSGVDLNNDGTIDLVYHASANLTKIGGPSADPNVEATPKSYNLRRLVVASNKGDGTWENTQIIDNVFQNAASKHPFYGNGISMTWADFNGDGYMDLFLGRGYGKTSNEQYQSRILFNDGRGKLEMSDSDGNKIGTTPSSMYTFGGNDGGSLLQGGPSLAVDWNADGKMDAIELPGFSHLDGATEDGNKGSINLYSNKSSGKKIEFGRTNLLGDTNTIGHWNYRHENSDAVTGAVAADIDWDGDRDLLVFTQQGNTRLITNTTPVADGTSLHFRILDAQGINALYGNTVQLFNSSGKLVSTQIINPQSGNQTNDSSAIVDFYGLDPKEIYTLAILRIDNGMAADVGGLETLGTNTIENVNAAWTGLKAGEANHAFVLTAESGTNFANANIGNGIVGTGYNDTFFATQGDDKYEGGGGTVTVSGVKAWSNTGGMDIVDYKLAGNTPLTINLSITGAQDTGFGTATFRNIEGLAGSRGSDTFTDNAADNQFEGRGGNDTFNLTGGGRDTLLYKLLSASDATGGNGADTVNRFEVGTFEATPNADRIDLKELLLGYTADADGAARYINGVAVIDSDDAIGNYLSVTVSGGNTTLSIDRDGSGSAYSATTLITLNGVTTDLATLLANHQIVLV